MGQIKRVEMGEGVGLLEDQGHRRWRSEYLIREEAERLWLEELGVI